MLSKEQIETINRAATACIACPFEVAHFDHFRTVATPQVVSELIAMLREERKYVEIMRRITLNIIGDATEHVIPGESFAADEQDKKATDYTVTQVPEGMTLVPNEATPGMLEAWQKHFGTIEGAYRAMLMESQKDAERYTWFKDHYVKYGNGDSDSNRPIVLFDGRWYGGHFNNHNDLSDAIDAAMQRDCEEEQL